jgi:hypothetical protein
MTPYRAPDLEKVDCEWDMVAAACKVKCPKLEAYKHVHKGPRKVPEKCDGNGSTNLGKWAAKQRLHYNSATNYLERFSPLVASRMTITHYSKAVIITEFYFKSCRVDPH